MNNVKSEALQLREQADKDRAAATAAQQEVNRMLRIKIGGIDGRQEQLVGVVGELMAEISNMKKQMGRLEHKYDILGARHTILRESMIATKEATDEQALGP